MNYSDTHEGADSCTQTLGARQRAPPVLCEVIGEPFKQSATLIGEPVKGRVKTGTSQRTGPRTQLSVFSAFVHAIRRVPAPAAAAEEILAKASRRLAAPSAGACGIRAPRKVLAAGWGAGLERRWRRDGAGCPWFHTPIPR